ncbi:hypothetical protein ACQCSX_21935 (plasmid) [Pseudarthrobacter sp. P1]|uniref:hypothetical protein n=1 Tax=Pseudarthrobacter sp. P1 TaxID=3418418 RepID=UPI003CF41918
MPEHVTVRETIEYTVTLEGWENGDFTRLSHVNAESTTTVLREIIGHHHEPDYVIGLDADKEVHILYADRLEVFNHRSHDAVIARFRDLTGYAGRLTLFDDLVDTDKSWFPESNRPEPTTAS